MESVQQMVKTVKPKENNLDNVNEIEPNQLSESDDEDEGTAEVTGIAFIILLKINKNVTK